MVLSASDRVHDGGWHRGVAQIKRHSTITNGSENDTALLVSERIFRLVYSYDQSILSCMLVHVVKQLFYRLGNRDSRDTGLLAQLGKLLLKRLDLTRHFQ